MVAGAGPDVGDGRAGGNLEGVEHGLGLFFVDACLAEQPVDPFPRHDVGNLPAHVKPGRSRRARVFDVRPSWIWISACADPAGIVVWLRLRQSAGPAG